MKLIFYYYCMNKKVIILISSLILLIIIGVVGYFLLYKKNPVAYDYNNENIVFAVVSPDQVDASQKERLDLKRKQALELYKTAPADSWTWIVIGNYHEFVKDYDKAIKDYERVLQLSPKDAMALQNLAHIYDSTKGDYAKAEYYYKQSIQSLPTGYQLYLDLALMYEYKMQKPTLAAATYLEGLKNLSNHPNLIIPLIRFYKRTGDAVEMQKYIKMLLDIDPANEQYKTEFGALLK